MTLSQFAVQATNEKILPSIIGAAATIIVFILGLLTKDFFEKRLLSSKLETEHKFEQRKMIKDVLAKNKVYLITACEDLNHRLWNFANKHEDNWIKVDGDYSNYHYYFHSFLYRFLAVFAWSKKIQKEMIFLDTTIASEIDLDFVKFLNVFPRFFCDLTFLEGIGADGNNSSDHFYRNDFELLSDCIITDQGIKSFAQFQQDLWLIAPKITKLSIYFDGLSPNEDRKRWDRLHFLHLTLILFLNNFGYDFQKTDKEKIKKVLEIPKKCTHLKKYFSLLSEYHLNDNREVKILKKIARNYL